MKLCSLLLISSLLYGLLSVASVSASRLVTAFTSGFQSHRSKSILEALLTNPVKESSSDDRITIYRTNGIGGQSKDHESSIQIAAIYDSNAALSISTGMDMSMIFIDSADILNENAVLRRLQDCFRSLLTSQSHRLLPEGKTLPTRSPFIIVYTGSAAAAPQLEYLLKEAWLLLDTEEERKEGQMVDTRSLFSLFDVQILLTPHELPQKDFSQQPSRGPMLNPAAIQAVSRAISKVASTANRTTFASLADAIASPQLNTTSNHTTIAPVVPASLLNFLNSKKITTTTTHIIRQEDSQGMELAATAMRVSLEKALLIANNSASTLTTLNTADPSVFATLVSQIVNNATMHLREYVNTSTILNIAGTNTIHITHANNISVYTNPTKVKSAISASALLWAKNELAYQLYVRLQPLYKRQVQLLKAVVASDFNRRVSASELPITIHILDDLHDIQKETIRNFTSLAAFLVPQHAPSALFNAEYETYELKQTMSEFILGREHYYRLLGVLPRGGNIGLTVAILGVKFTLPPTDVGFYLLASHPLGRDYRQDVLGMRKTDQFDITRAEQLYSEQAWKGKAWGFLKNTVKNTALKLIKSDFSSQKATLKRQNEAKPESAWMLRQKLKEKVIALEAQLQQEQQQSRQSMVQRFDVRRLVSTLPLQSQLYNARKDAEFAREMAMLPLSLKNPDLGGQDPETPAEAAARRKDKKQREKDLSAHELGYAYSVHTDQPATDWMRSVSQNILINRLKKGPERFIRWDVEPLKEAKQQLDEIASRQAGAVPKVDQRNARAFAVGLPKSLDDYLQDVTDKVPLYRNSRYRHPEINYGPAYDPQPHPEIYADLVDPKKK